MIQSFNEHLIIMQREFDLYASDSEYNRFRKEIAQLELQSGYINSFYRACQSKDAKLNKIFDADIKKPARSRFL